MHIVHYHSFESAFPIQGYGGGERQSYWMGKGHAEMGHKVTYLCHNRRSDLPFAKVIEIPPFEQNGHDDLRPYLPSDVDIVQLHGAGYNYEQYFPRLDCPYLLRIGGNCRRIGSVLPPNTVFVSANHAKRHNWTEYVHNGVDLKEYPTPTCRERDKDYLVFLAKASWGYKNLPDAIRVARKSGRELHVGGGYASFWHRHVKSYGTVDGKTKMGLLHNALGLIYPVLWDEPCANAVIEALACGTPAIVTRRGGLPELIDSSCGVIADSFQDMVEGVYKLKDISPEACRQRVKENFSHITMAEKYMYYYRKILKDGKIREGSPIVSENAASYVHYEDYDFWKNLPDITFQRVREGVRKRLPHLFQDNL